MKSLLASVHDGGGLDRVDHAVQLLEDEWRRHGDVPLERFWKEQKRLLGSDPEDSVVLLSEMIKADLRCRFARGQTPAVADYLTQFPELDEADTRVLSLIYEEFCLVEERGDRVDVTAFCDRYPRWKESLASQLQYHHLLSQAAGARPKAPPFPEAGDTFEEFQLASLLGRGGTSRVFIAKDLSLGGKQVVLKVSLDRGREPQAQGALDHPHIVPVNSVAFSDDGMRGLSMPYRPGLPLDEVIRRIAPASKPRRAMALWEALVRAPETPTDPATPGQAAPPVEIRAPGPRGDGWEGFPVRGTYSQGVAWVVKIVASALQYAHGQLTFHRDVKPANVLLTVQHGPQLLDFNLAESPHSASQAQAAMQGGTLPYMAPEQIEAFLNPELWGKVGARADLYSLGLVLRELLTGQAPDLPAETLAPARAMRVLLDRRPLLDVTVRRANPAIPHALEAIVARCLAISPEDRYRDAGALAEDLDRFLHHRPLFHAVNPSRGERSANWAVRNRLRVAVSAACLGPFLFLLGWVARGAMNAPGPLPPIASSQVLRTAVKALDEDSSEQESIEPLYDLVKEYRESGLPRLYLCLAHQVRENNMDAERRFEELLRMPDARKELLDWSSNDPELPKRLERFAFSRFKRAKEIKNPSEPVRKELQRKQYVLAKEASKLSLEIRSDSDDSLYCLACAEAHLGHPELALHRAESALHEVEKAIEAISSQQKRDPEVVIDLERRLYHWRATRSWAITKLAELLRIQGSSPARKALDALSSAKIDLDGCDRFVSTKPAVMQHEVEEIRVQTLMISAEIELDLGLLKAAGAHLRSAKTSCSRYKALSEIVGRTQELDRFYERIDEIGRRLNQESARSAGRDPDPPAKATASLSRTGR